MILIGDVHGQFTRLLHELRFVGRGINYIQVGDFGLGFYDEDYDKKVLTMLDILMTEKDSHFFIIRGNHDNPEIWNRDHDYNRVHLVRDNELLEIENKQVFFLGGGISIDRTQRTVGVDYWIDELVDVDLERIDQLDHIDIVVSHIAPGGGVWPTTFSGIVYDYHKIEHRHGMDLIKDLDLERDLMTMVSKRLLSKGVKHWFYGHYHQNHITMIDDVEYRCIDIMEYHEHKVVN